MPPTKTYTKPALNSVDLVAHLQNKGLSVPAPADAISAIERFGYYRLLIYMLPLQDPATKLFQPGRCFNDILELYEFDRQLRLLCLDAIERIEVALRSTIVQSLAVAYGPHFYLDPIHYSSSQRRNEFVAKARQADYLALTHYRKTYAKPKDAPIWAVLEAITFGTLSKLFADLNLQNRKLVAKPFGFDEKVLVSWFRTLTVLRNMCAHHNRLWNFSFKAYQPQTAKSLSGVFAGQDSFHARAVVLTALLDRIGHASDWKTRMVGHINSSPTTALPSAMGYPVNWQADPFWS